MSQMVDSVMVVSVTFGAAYLRGDITTQALAVLVGSNYLFKATVALLDTGPFYLAAHYLRRYLRLEPGAYAAAEHAPGEAAHARADA